MAKAVRWGIIGTGSVAGRVMNGFKETPPDLTEVVAVGSRNRERAETFARDHGIPRSYGSYEGVVTDPKVDLVYVALPNHLHCPWSLKAISGGKHVLCEKPFTLNLAEAKKVVAAAEKKGVFLMEAFMYRCHPQIAKVRELLKAGMIGEVRVMAAGFAYAGIDEDNWPMMLTEGGGGLMDVGTYPVSFFRMVTGEEPVSASCLGVLGKKSKVDHWAAGVLKFPGGAVAHFDSGMMVNTDCDARVYGTAGKLRVPQPWVPGARDGAVEVTLYADGKTEIIPCPAKHIFANEAEAVARAINAGKIQAPEMAWADTLGQMRALDMLRASLRLFWLQEKKQGDM